MNTLLCVLLGYFAGTLNPTFIIGKTHGINVKKEGSRNAGASNAVILMGKAVGAFCALFDIMKAYFSYRLANLFFPLVPAAGILAGAACIIGHIFPIWMHFQGGKGLACLGGMILAYDWKVFGVLLLLEVVLVLITDYICIVAISASSIFPFIYQCNEHLWPITFILIIIAFLIFIKHKENIRRILHGQEARVSYLWNKEKEIKRLENNYK